MLSTGALMKHNRTTLHRAHGGHRHTISKTSESYVTTRDRATHAPRLHHYKQQMAKTEGSLHKRPHSN